MQLEPEFERLRRDGELDVAVEVPLLALKKYEPRPGSPDLELNKAYLEAEYRWIMLKALAGVCRKYELSDKVVLDAISEIEAQRSPNADENLRTAAEAD